MRRQLLASLRLLGWLAVGMLAVSGVYGAVGAVLGDTLPQLSEATTAAGMPVRLVQSSVGFGLIGLALGYMGLAAVGVVPDVLAGLKARFAYAHLLRAHRRVSDRPAVRAVPHRVRTRRRAGKSALLERPRSCSSRWATSRSSRCCSWPW